MRLFICAGEGSENAGAGNDLMRLVHGVLLGAVLLLPAACADRGDSPGEDSALPVGNVEIGLADASLHASVERVGAGETQFTIVNRGQYPHGVVIRGNGFEQTIQSVAPGMQTVLTVDLKPGTYTLSCPFNDSHGDHDQIGERIALVVAEPGS